MEKKIRRYFDIESASDDDLAMALARNNYDNEDHYAK